MGIVSGVALWWGIIPSFETTSYLLKVLAIDNCPLDSKFFLRLWICLNSVNTPDSESIWVEFLLNSFGLGLYCLDCIIARFWSLLRFYIQLYAHKQWSAKRGEGTPRTASKSHSGAKSRHITLLTLLFALACSLVSSAFPTRILRSNLYKRDLQGLSGLGTLMIEASDILL